MLKARELIQKYRDIIPYMVFGVGTTIVNVAAYWCCTHLFAVSTMLGTIIAWVLAVLFAYITNRKWVFKSKANSKSTIAKEIVIFLDAELQQE